MLCISERWVPDPRIDAVAEYALAINASVLLVHVALGNDSGGSDTPGEQALEKISAYLKNKNVRAEDLLLISDDIAAAVIKTAEEHQCTQIMLGLSSKGVLARLIEGSVSQEVVRATRIPVMLLPPEWRGKI